MTKSFRVVSVSKNTNSFGLRGVILLALDGSCWEVAANQLTVEDLRLMKGADIKVPQVSGRCQWAAMGFELPRQLPEAPLNVLNEVYPDRAARVRKLVSYGGLNPDENKADISLLDAATALVKAIKAGRLSGNPYCNKAFQTLNEVIARENNFKGDWQDAVVNDLPRD